MILLLGRLSSTEREDAGHAAAAQQVVLGRTHPHRLRPVALDAVLWRGCLFALRCCTAHVLGDPGEPGSGPLCPHAAVVTFLMQICRVLAGLGLLLQLTISCYGCCCHLQPFALTRRLRPRASCARQIQNTAHFFLFLFYLFLNFVSFFLFFSPIFTCIL